jgi:hypothetical protein
VFKVVSIGTLVIRCCSGVVEVFCEMPDVERIDGTRLHRHPMTYPRVIWSHLLFASIVVLLYIKLLIDGLMKDMYRVT